jgi:hypothetical protein
MIAAIMSMEARAIGLIREYLWWLDFSTKLYCFKKCWKFQLFYFFFKTHIFLWRKNEESFIIFEIKKIKNGLFKIFNRHVWKRSCSCTIIIKIWNFALLCTTNDDQMTWCQNINLFSFLLESHNIITRIYGNIQFFFKKSFSLIL